MTSIACPHCRPWRSLLTVGASAAHAVDAVNVRLDAAAIDLTEAVERQRTDADRIQVSTAPGPDGIVRRIEVRAREGNTNWAVFALANNERRADRPADRRAALPHGRLRAVLARPRALAHRHHHAELGRPPGAPGQRDRRHFPHHARSRHRDHLRRRAAHRQAAAALSVGARRLQGQGQQLHALPRHRHRHRRPAGAVPHHPVRGEGQRHVPGRGRARLGGAGLYRHRLRLLGQGVRHVVGRRAGLARRRRGDSRGDAAGVPVRLSQSQSLARALRPHHHRLAAVLGALVALALFDPADRRRHRAHVAVAGRGARALRSSSISRRTASTAPCC